MPIREVVSQISPPIRIVLVLAVAVLGAYMLFLRPKPEEIPPLEPAGTSTTQPGQVRDAAEDAVDAANSQLEQQESVDGVDAGEAAAGTAPATKAGKQGNAAKGAAAGEPAEDLKGLPKPVRKAIRDNKVLVVLFSNGKSYDDKAVEKALTKVNRWDGRVFVHTAPLRKISKYGRIARGVSVEQSPTVVVADRTLRAETLVGYTDRATIDQAVVDARQNSTGIYVDSYLKAADKVCFAHSNRLGQRALLLPRQRHLVEAARSPPGRARHRLGELRRRLRGDQGAREAPRLPPRHGGRHEGLRGGAPQGLGRGHAQDEAGGRARPVRQRQRRRRADRQARRQALHRREPRALRQAVLIRT